MDYDDIVVGAGSSGAVLAARLSEDSNRSVMLLEAGADYPAVEQTPSDLLHTWISAGPHDWGFVAKATRGSRDRLPARQGHRRLLCGQRAYRAARHARGFRRMGRLGQLRSGVSRRFCRFIASSKTIATRRATFTAPAARSGSNVRAPTPGSRSIAPFTRPRASSAMPTSGTTTIRDRPASDRGRAIGATASASRPLSAISIPRAIG